MSSSGAEHANKLAGLIDSQRCMFCCMLSYGLQDPCLCQGDFCHNLKIIPCLGRLRQGRTEVGRRVTHGAGQSRAGQGRAGQGREGRNRAGQVKRPT